MSVTGPSLLIKLQTGGLTPFAIHQGPCSLITEMKTAKFRLSSSLCNGNAEGEVMTVCELQHF